MIKLVIRKLKAVYVINCKSGNTHIKYVIDDDRNYIFNEKPIIVKDIDVKYDRNCGLCTISVEYNDGSVSRDIFSLDKYLVQEYYVKV